MEVKSATTCPLWPAKKRNFLTTNPSKYAGFFALILPPFFENIFRPPGHEKSNQKCELRGRKRVRFGRQNSGSFLPSKYAGIPASNLQPSLKIFRPPGHGRIGSEMRFNVPRSPRSPRASQSTTDRGKNVVLNRIKPNPILHSWVGPEIVKILQLFKLLYSCKSLEWLFCLTLMQKQLNFSSKNQQFVYHHF